MATPRRPGATDPAEDALARRQEEFRRCLIGVVGPALEELRAALRREGRDAAVRVRTAPGAPTEAVLAVSYRGVPEFACVVRAAVAPERATVPKRRPVPAPGGEREEEGPLLGAPGPASDARSITRADVVRSVLADYRALRRARGGG